MQLCTSMRMDAEPSTLEEVRSRAKSKMKGICGVFGVCNGDRNRICQGNSYGKTLRFGGIGSGTSFWNNFVALDNIKLHMKTIIPHFTPDTSG
jgi:4-hydroxymandelate oxidase